MGKAQKQCEYWVVMGNKHTTYLLWILAVLSSVPILLYLFYFGGNGISKNLSDWSGLGDFIGGIYSVITSVVAVYITYILHKQRVEFDEKMSKIQDIQQKERLDFDRKLSETKNNIAIKINNDNIIRDKYYDCIEHIVESYRRITAMMENLRSIDWNDIWIEFIILNYYLKISPKPNKAKTDLINSISLFIRERDNSINSKKTYMDFQYNYARYILNLVDIDLDKKDYTVIN